MSARVLKCPSTFIVIVAFVLAMALTPRSALAQGEWVPMGPPGGPMATIAMDPTNPANLYVGTLFGVVRSTDGGNTWSAADTGLPGLPVTVLAINPQTPSIVYAVAAGGRVFRTTNSGGVWSEVTNALPTTDALHYRNSLVIDPTTPTTLFYSQSYNRLVASVYRSTNSGASWTPASVGLPGDDEFVYSLVSHPSTPGTLYAGGKGKVFRSTDFATTWTQISTNLDARAGRQGLAIDPITPTTMYYAGNELTQGGVWRSRDGGVTWTHRLGGAVGPIAIDPVTPSHIYIGTFFAGVWKSTDGGDTWARSDTGLYPIGGGATAFAINPLAPAQIFVSTSGGVFRTTNSGQVWTPMNQGLSTFASVIRLALHPTNPRLFAHVGNAVQTTTDLGANWSHLPDGGLGPLVFHPVTPTTIYSAARFQGVLRSLDSGTTWTPLNTGFPPLSETELVAVDPVTPTTLYAAVKNNLGNVQVYRSVNDGATWTSTASLSNASVPIDLLIDPQTPSTLYFNAYQLYRTRNRGDSWTPLSIGEQIVATRLAIDPITPSILYAATFQHGVFRSTDSGDTWNPINNGLPSLGGNHLVVDPVTPSTLYTSTAAGIFRTTNSGSSWTPMSAGLAAFGALIPYALAVDPLTPAIVYLGTERAAFRWQPINERRLSILRQGSGVGTVTSAPPGVSCGADCAELFATGTVVTLSAAAEVPAAFVSFGGHPDCTDGVVTLADNVTCTATFNLPTHELTVATNGAGSGTVTTTPPGISCGTDCSEPFPLGTVVTLTATPAAGSVLTSWNGACAGATFTCQVTISSARLVTVTFGMAAPAAFFKHSPANGLAGVSTVNAVLGWTAASQATSYEYCYDTTNNHACESGTWTQTESLAFEVLNSLAPSTTYYWQVRAVNSGGTIEADNGVWWRFTTWSTRPPTANDDAYSVQAGATLVVPPPGVLANDEGNGAPITAYQVTAFPQSGSVAANLDGSFTYTPNTGFSGVDTFQYRAYNPAGGSNLATVTITVTNPTIVEPPFALEAWSIVGNVVTLRWNAPGAGLAPSGYVIEGGLTPGSVLASIPTESRDPVFTFTAPTGAFYVRVHAVSGTLRSAASNEIRIFVNTPALPSAPVNLLGMAFGPTLALSWRNTFGGGAPDAVILDVTGTFSVSLRLGLVESFTFTSVPPGAYTFRVRAENAAGSSTGSNPVALTFPSTTCTGRPDVPVNFLAYRVGSTIHVMWDPAPSGSAATTFQLNVEGSVSTSIITPLRRLSGSVGPGIYRLTVFAINSCGTSVVTPVQTVQVP